MSRSDRLHAAIGAVLFNAMNFPEKVQARVLGQDMAPLREKIADAILGSDWLAERVLEAQEIAWDAGYYRGVRDNEADTEPSDNPYRGTPIGEPKTD